jgi:Tol biopolymer transport system component
VVSKKAGTDDWDIPRQLTFDSVVSYGGRWSPNGLWIAYISNGIRVISPQGGKPRVLVSGDDPSVSPKPAFCAWSRDSRVVYYRAFDDSERTSFWGVPLEGGKPRLLVKFDDPTKQSSRPDFTTDGYRLFFTISKYEGDIWKMELLREE